MPHTHRMPTAQRWSLAAVFAGLLLSGGATVHSLLGLVRAQQTLDAAYRSVHTTDALLRLVLIAEIGQRGYLIAGTSDHLAPYHVAVSEVRGTRRQLEQMVTDPQAKAQLNEMLALVDEKLQELAQAVSMHVAGQSEQAVAGVRDGQGLALMEKLGASAQRFSALQNESIAQLQAAHDQAIKRAYITTALAMLTGVGLLLLVVARGVAFARRMADNEADLTTRNAELLALAERTSEHNAHMQRLSQLGRFLQTCADMAEAQALLQERLPVLLHAASGALYLMSASRNQLRRCVAWGERPFTEYFEPQECWALRKGQPFAQPDHGQASTCRHLQQGDEPSLQGTLCFPVASHGDLTGLLVLDPHGASVCLPEALLAQLRQTALEQVSLSLGNLRLRESLRQQSIRDALTGLYNRRFLDESLTREVLRAERRSPDQPDTPLAVLMIDVDHFKQFNDKFGHELGDRVLRSVAQTLTDTVRASDLVARYGGEEFTVVLPNTTPQVALERAQALCDAVMKMPPVADGGNVHPPITISVGMACMPDDGQDADALVQNADAALYRAKRDGRNRVVRYTAGG
ncbi:diguanylate cyclase [Acidovorax sp. 106]|uniref:diguanylate cyclase n=1 Tax=Acidovorax sp. 106 TaxID=2135637 RepID=UPI000EB323F9|nr:diguanylate cyclase [Acidovorax sp. 106]RLJ39734.1 diguanylate cyclase (GGDEF)-like protein [Acidovorax sp. 106]